MINMSEVDAVATAAAAEAAELDEASQKRKAVDYTIVEFGAEMPASDPRKAPERTKPSKLNLAIASVIADVQSGAKSPVEYYGVARYQTPLGASGAANRFRKLDEDKRPQFDGELTLNTARKDGVSFLGVKFLPTGWDAEDTSTWQITEVTGAEGAEGAEGADEGTEQEYDYDVED